MSSLTIKEIKLGNDLDNNNNFYIKKISNSHFNISKGNLTFLEIKDNKLNLNNGSNGIISTQSSYFFDDNFKLKIFKSQNICILDGTLRTINKFTTESILLKNIVFANINSINMRPLSNVFTTAYIFNGTDSYQQKTCKISSNGDISLVEDATIESIFISLNATWSTFPPEENELPIYLPT